MSGAGQGPNRNEKWSVVGRQSQRVAEHKPAGSRRDVKYKALQKLRDNDAQLLKPFVGQYLHVTVLCYRENMILKRGRKFLLESLGEFTGT